MVGFIDEIKINGRVYNLNILMKVIRPERRDSEGAGRSAAVNQDLIKDSNGYLYHFTAEFAGVCSENADFKDLFDTIMTLGSEEFLTVELELPTGAITQEMDATGGDIEYKMRMRDGVTLWGSWEVKFEARRIVHL